MKPLLPLLLLVAAGPAVAATPILPGYWESTNRVTSPITDEKTERRCITPADIDKFIGGPSNRHYSCTYPTRVIAGGRITLKGSCVDKKGRQIMVAGRGAYTPTSFSLEADIAMEFLGLPITGRASTEARRIGDACPAPADPAPADPAPAAASVPAPAPTPEPETP